MGVKNITKDDLAKVVERYGSGESIDYVQMSKDLGLHFPSFNLIYKSTKRKQNVERLHDLIKGKTDSDRRLSGLQELISGAEFKINKTENPLDRLAFGITQKSVGSRNGSINGSVVS